MREKKEKKKGEKIEGVGMMEINVCGESFGTPGCCCYSCPGEGRGDKRPIEDLWTRWW